MHRPSCRIFTAARLRLALAVIVPAALSTALCGQTAPSTAPATTATMPADPGGKVLAFHFTGNSAIRTEDLEKIVDPLLKKGTATAADIEEARRKLTQAYIDRGYINSGVLLAGYDEANGIVNFQVIEGKLTDVHINEPEKHWLRPQYVRDRIELGAGTPLNLLGMRQELELLRQNPNIEQINADLRPGLHLGDALLDTSYRETNPFHLGLVFDDRRPPSVGSTQISLLASDTDVTGFGDSFNFRWGLTTGGLEQIEFNDVRDVSLSYTVPITRWDTTLTLAYSRTNSTVIENTFNNLNIRSDLESYTFHFRQPVYRTPSTEFALWAGMSFRQNATWLLNEPFSFSPDQRNGVSRVTDLQVGQEFSLRDNERVLSLDSTFTFGIDGLGATGVGDGNVGSQYAAFLLQGQYVQRLFGTDNTAIARLAGQWASGALPAVEQFSLGGVDTVRGYPENQAVRDDAVAASLEFQIPLLHANSRSILEFAPFVDLGFGHNAGAPGKDVLLASVGPGLLFHPDRHVDFQIYYGYPLHPLDHNVSDIQDLGVHFSLTLWAF